MGKYVSSLIAVLLIVSQVATPFTAFAQTINTTSNTNVGNPRPVTGTQANTFNQGNTQGASNQNAPVGEAVGEAIGCSVGQILGGIVQAGVSGIINEIKNQVSVDQITDSMGQYVPTDPQTIKQEIKNINKDTARQTNKETGGGHLGLIDSLTSSVSSVSWDSIGFCLANATIRYFTQATVNWINSGFEGNPAFVDNPEQFFQDLADIELGGFMDELGLGFLCSGNLPKVRIALINDYANRTSKNSFNDKYKCSFEQIGTTVDAFVNDFQQGGINAFVEYTFNPASRVTTSYLAARDELNKRIQDKTTIAQFELRVSDFLNFKKCETVKDPKTQKEKQVNCKTYTPGQMIEEQANNAINSPRNRLEIADEFDEIIAALVNQLIKAALSEMTSIDSDGNNDGDDEDTDEDDDDNGGTPPPAQTPDSGYVPTPVVPVTGVCRVSTTTIAVDEPVQLTVVPRGGNGSYVLDWLGSPDFPTSTRQTQLTISFASTTAASDIDVRIRSAGRAAIVPCPEIRVTPPVPLVASCKPDDATVAVGESVTWESEVSGGTGFYTYEWSGDINTISKTSQDNTVTYNDDGRYEASLTVKSGSQTKQVSCTGTVRVR